MDVVLEISYYPIEHDSVDDEVKDFLERIDRFSDVVETQVGPVSTLIKGEYDEIMHLLDTELKNTFEQHAAVFVMKLSNKYPA